MDREIGNYPAISGEFKPPDVSGSIARQNLTERARQALSLSVSIGARASFKINYLILSFRERFELFIHSRNADGRSRPSAAVVVSVKENTYITIDRCDRP